MEYEQLSKSYEYGLSKIYELVINNDPCYAYLMEGNEFLDQKLVMAHVYGHCDFFKNNMWFAPTHRKMMDEMANHATRVRRYMDRFGVEEVENFIDRCLSIENLIDRHAPYTPIKVDVQDEDDEDRGRATAPTGWPSCASSATTWNRTSIRRSFLQEQAQKREEESDRVARFSGET